MLINEWGGLQQYEQKLCSYYQKITILYSDDMKLYEVAMDTDVIRMSESTNARKDQNHIFFVY